MPESRARGPVVPADGEVVGAALDVDPGPTPGDGVPWNTEG